MTSRLGWEPVRSTTLVKAALTMNLSIVDVQGRYAVYGRLTETQRKEIELHPAQAVARLRASGVDDEAWLRAVLQHHEREDGQGYPSRLTEIDELAQMLRMADVFMAKISPRAERQPLTIQDAARQLFSESRASPAASALIKEYGIFPPGNLVRLASGELAVVILRGATALTPVAAAITDRSGNPIIKTVRRDTSQPAYAIKALAQERADTLRIPAERLFGLAE